MGDNRIKLLVLRLTEDCNLRCKYCYACGGDRAITMTKEVAFHALDYVAINNNHFQVQFTGGEPLLAMDLIEAIINYGYKKGRSISYQIQTNGTLINKKVAKKLKDLNIAVGVSLDGIPEINDLLRVYPSQKGSAGDVLNGLYLLGRQGIKVGLTTTITKYNINYLSSLIDLASYLGNVYGINFDLYRPLGRGVDMDFTISDFKTLREGILKSLYRASEIKKMGGSQIHFKELDKILYLLKKGEKREKYCYAVTGTSFAVLSDGSVYPCSSLAGISDFYLGNIMNSDFSPFSQLKVFNLNVNLQDNKKCRNCFDKWLCGGGCIARAYAYYKRFDKVYEGECILRKTYIDYLKNSLKKV